MAPRVVEGRHNERGNESIATLFVVSQNSHQARPQSAITKRLSREERDWGW